MDEKVPAGDMIRVEVAFAHPESQEILELAVPRGCTALEAVVRSGFREKYSAYLDPVGEPAVGIFGVVLPRPDEYVLEENDRVEIYRPLAKDPKQARLERVRKKSS